MNTPRLVWLDLETTGLDETRGKILECGIIVTTPDLEIVDRRSWVFYVTPGDFLFPDDEKAYDMHATSGLLHECRALPKTHTPFVFDGVISGVIREATAGNGVASPLYGSSVQFDRRWLSVHMPRTHAVFHYRNGDATHYRLAAERLGIEPPAKRGAHRALDDLEDSIALMRWGDSIMRKGAT